MDKGAKRTVGKYINSNYGWAFNLIASNILFWLAGFPTVQKYGYSSDNYDIYGGIPSGGEGSGVFIVTLVLMCICYIVYFGRMAAYLLSDEPHKDD
ncbi:hypothetical protein SDRG_05051 [Saprolegnia diclina VS20]|uniref:Uncharacterized protein n=1 Tax=Saprolegnia diclina (strain VS20) TaxID=1156394 RepID=T0RXX1_SAPDV|nr:hypothetical protein SDRG_05051 [Saprolegnia diclina VS20]EQC37448.1 hypothetical protein SDRG_05051 [Saprolegnia diclina VS20]|eukprot:XP_008608968.1 hypothetical protein SDRG_05051 [Saprolegnia diclina VS20]